MNQDNCSQKVYGISRGGQQEMMGVCVDGRKEIDERQDVVNGCDKQNSIIKCLLTEQAEINKQTSASIEHIYIKLHELLGGEVVEKERKGNGEIEKNSFGLIGELRFMQNQAGENLKKLYGISATLNRLVG